MRFAVVREKKLIIQMFLGELTYEKWLKSAEAVWQHPDYDKTFCGLIDFRKTKIQMGVKEIKSIVEILSKETERALSSDAVLLINQPTAAAFASIFADSIKSMLKANIVTTEEGAAKKLDVDLSVFEAINGPDAVKLILD